MVRNIYHDAELVSKTNLVCRDCDVENENNGFIGIYNITNEIFDIQINVLMCSRYIDNQCDYMAGLIKPQFENANFKELEFCPKCGGIVLFHNGKVECLNCNHTEDHLDIYKNKILEKINEDQLRKNILDVEFTVLDKKIKNQLDFLDVTGPDE